MSIKESVKRFNHIKGTPPVSIDGDREAFWKSVQHQAALVLEESKEQYEAAMNRDIINTVDGAADVAYTQAYMDVMLEEVGIDLSLAKSLVCDNNDQKITTDQEFAKRSAIKLLENAEMVYVDETWYDRMFYYVVKRKLDGKVLKLIGHQSPNIADAIPEETFKFVGEKVVSS